MLIGHYMHRLREPGGIASYIERVSAGLAGRGHSSVFLDSSVAVDDGATLAVTSARNLSERAVAAGVDVLHLHLDPGGPIEGLPHVRTHHGHHAYCPSASQYLTNRSRPCERRFGVGRCTWGHLVDHCGSVRPHLFLQDFRRYHQEHRSAEACPVIIANSQFVGGRLIRDGYPSGRIRVLANPAPPGSHPAPLPQAGPPRVLFLGRVAAQKGLHWLIEALARTEVAHLDVCGTGPQEGEARSRVAELGLSDRVVFHGWQPPASVEDLIVGCRVVVVPSVWHEPAGLAAIEGASWGRAVIASETGGLPEIVSHGVTGFLVKPLNVSGLAAAIDRLSADAGLAAGMGTAGAERAARNHSLEDHLTRLIEAYEDAGAAAGPPPGR